jgi:hypothetical protein
VFRAMNKFPVLPRRDLRENHCKVVDLGRVVAWQWPKSGNVSLLIPCNIRDLAGEKVEGAHQKP